jgi:heme/copper-type cytochrome/quinol oxidase subunit 4
MSDMDRTNTKEVSFDSSVQRMAMVVTLVTMLTNVPIVANSIWLLLKTANFTCKNKSIRQ